MGREKVFQTIDTRKEDLSTYFETVAASRFYAAMNREKEKC